MRLVMDHMCRLGYASLLGDLTVDQVLVEYGVGPSGQAVTRLLPRGIRQLRSARRPCLMIWFDLVDDVTLPCWWCDSAPS